MKTYLTLSTMAFVLASQTPGAVADYTLELKNGRRITVQSYREEAGMIKFRGLGGEIAIGKDQILAIRPADGTDSNSFNIGQADAQARRASAASGPGKPGTERVKPADAKEERDKEEKQYQDKLKALTDELRAARDDYSQAIRGTTGADPTQLTTDKQLQARQDDITSRFKEAQRNPTPPAPVKLLVPSPFSSLPPTVEDRVAGQPSPDLGRPQPQTASEQALTDMRNRATQLEQQRDRIINEMRQKNFSTGDLFLE